MGMMMILFSPFYLPSPARPGSNRRKRRICNTKKKLQQIGGALFSFHFSPCQMERDSYLSSQKQDASIEYPSHDVHVNGGGGGRAMQSSIASGQQSSIKVQLWAKGGEKRKSQAQRDSLSSRHFASPRVLHVVAVAPAVKVEPTAFALAGDRRRRRNGDALSQASGETYTHTYMYKDKAKYQYRVDVWG